jgi:DNA-directed RNA polymerase subunit RPC12/RpoP
MRRNRYGVPLPTVADFARLGHDLATWCKACDRPGRRLVAEDLLETVGPGLTVPELERRLRCRRCGAKGLVELRISVRATRRHIPGGEPAALPNAARLVARTLEEAQPALGREAEALADAVVKTLYAAGYL